MRSRRSFVVGLLLATSVLVGSAGPEGEPFAASFARDAVAADHPLASEAGAEILAAGGNAADAAAATMLALGVASPASSGLGGGGFALYYRASDGSLTFLDFRETAPAAATPDMFVDAPPAGEGPLSGASELGGLASGVPGEPAGIAALVERFGRLPLAQVARPALRLAEDGVPVSIALARRSAPFAAQLRRDPVLGSWFEGEAPALLPGYLLRQPELARTLRAFGRGGARAIYRGRIARAIVEANRAAGGILTLADLAAYRVVVREPLEGRFLGYRWVTAPPPSAGGFTLLSSLAVLARIPARWRTEEAARLHALAESWKGPFLDRQRYFGDPDHVALPLEALMTEARLRARAAAFHPNLAQPAARYALPLRPPNPNLVQSPGAGTSHLCVVDAEGNIASVTTTINLPFGARYTAAGMVMNDEMDDFAREVGEANAFGLVGGEANLPGPGKRMVSTMTPTIVFDDRGPVLCIGAAGGSQIVTATEQVALQMLARDRSARDAIAAPRIHHQGAPDVLLTEEHAPLPSPLLASLRARGHAHDTVSYVAVVQLIRILRDAGGSVRLDAASDPRKGGEPRGR